MNTSRGPLVWRGILAVVIGVVAVVWPGITVGAFVILFAFYAFMAAAMEAIAAFRTRSAGHVLGRLLLAGLDIVAGVVALTWPGITAYALVVVIAAWAWSPASPRSCSRSVPAKPPVNEACSPSRGWSRSRWASCSRSDPMSAL